MTSISSFLGDDHDRCDDLFSQAERSIDAQDWDQAGRDFAAFQKALEQHLAVEEDTLFPAFEQATGSSAGPTSVMRMEHKQMRDVLAEMAQAVEQRDATDFLGGSETLNILMQQHNLKEESILYPMCDRALGSGQEAVLETLESRLSDK
jgi:iron-sulfur cluster repair protein YtfE (RIC family)